MTAQEQHGPHYSVHRFRQEVNGTIPDYNGTLDFDYDQCVDCVNTWAWVIGIQQSYGNAAQLDFSNDCEWIANDPTNHPVPGDILIWNGYPADPSFGHTAVALHHCTEWNIRSLDVNWPEGSGYHLQLHSYQGVAGWWHPRKIGNQGARY